MNHVETEKNLRVLYGCYIPKIDLSKTEVYHKELIVFAVQDEEIIGAETFDFKGNSRPIDHTELVYRKHLVYKHTDIIKGGASLLQASSPVLKQGLMFNTKTEAYLQKLVLLNQVRELFVSDSKDRKKHIDSKIPINIADILKDAYNDHPEVLL